MADDVTDKAPLKGGRQRANHIQVHRIELGLWERKHIAEPLIDTTQFLAASKSVESIGKGLYYGGMVIAAGASAYAIWWTLDTIYDWGKKATDNAQAVVGDAKTNPANPIYWAIPAPIRVLWKLF